jgi:hypothetical protein
MAPKIANSRDGVQHLRRVVTLTKIENTRWEPRPRCSLPD